MIELENYSTVACGTCGSSAVRHRFSLNLPDGRKAVVFHDTHTDIGTIGPSTHAVLQEINKRYEQLHGAFCACSASLIGWGIGVARITRIDFASEGATACKPRTQAYPIISWQMGGFEPHRFGLPAQPIGEIDSARIIDQAHRVMELEIQKLRCERCNQIIEQSSEQFKRLMMPNFCLMCRWELIEQIVGPHLKSVTKAITNEELLEQIKDTVRQHIERLRTLTERGVRREDTATTAQKFQHGAQKEAVYWRKIDNLVKRDQQMFAHNPVLSFVLHISFLTAQRRYWRWFLRKRFSYDVRHQRRLRSLPLGTKHDPKEFTAAIQCYGLTQVALMDGFAEILRAWLKGKVSRDALIESAAAMTQASRDRHRIFSFAPMNSPFPDVKEAALISLTGWVASEISRRNSKRQKQTLAVENKPFSDALWDTLPQSVELAWSQWQPHESLASGSGNKKFLSRVREMLEAERPEEHRQSDLLRKARNRVENGERVLTHSETVSVSSFGKCQDPDQRDEVDIISVLIDPKTEEFALRESAREEKRRSLLDILDQLANSDQLSSRERELLNLRLQHPDATNFELAGSMKPPVREGTVVAMNNHIKKKARKIAGLN